VLIAVDPRHSLANVGVDVAASPIGQLSQGLCLGFEPGARVGNIRVSGVFALHRPAPGLAHHIASLKIVPIICDLQQQIARKFTLGIFEMHACYKDILAAAPRRVWPKKRQAL